MASRLLLHGPRHHRGRPWSLPERARSLLRVGSGCFSMGGGPFLCETRRVMTSAPTHPAPATCGGSPATATRPSSAASRAAWRAISGCRCSGCGPRSCSPTALGGLGIAMYIGLWLVVPSDSRFETGTPGAESASRGGRRPGRVRRIADAGPAIALAALALGMILVVQATIGGGAVFWPIVIGLAGVALLWRQADEVQRERWLDTSGRLDPVRMVFGSGGLAAYARVAAGAVLVVVALIVVGVHGSLLRRGQDRAGRRAARRRRAGPGRRAVGLPARLRPRRRARGADPGRGAGRRGRAPARLGAADAGADPEERQRPEHRGPAGPRPGARPAVLAVRRRVHRRVEPGRRAARRGRARSRTRTASRSTWSPSATASSTSRCARSSRPPARRSPTPRSTPAPAGSTSMPRSPRARSTSSSATAAPASPSTTCPRTGTASAAASSTGWSGTAAPPRSARPRARAPRSGCTCPDPHSEENP